MKALLSLIICAFALPALAGQGSYFKGGLGYSIGGDAEFDSGSSADFDSSFMNPISLSYGTYSSENISIEFEFALRDGDFENSTTDYTALSLSANLVNNMNIESAIKPYFGAGISAGTYELGTLDSEFGAALQFMAGADFLINGSSSLGFELRHHMTVLHPEYEGDSEVEFTFTEIMATYKVSL